LKLKEADRQLEQIINFRRQTDPNYQIKLPFTFILDKNYDFLYANIAYYLHFKIETDMLIGKNNKQFDTDQFPQMRTVLDRVFNTGKTHELICYAAVPKCEKRAFECVLNPLYGDLGNIEAVIATARDITEKLALEETQKKQKRIYENLVENFPDIIARHDRNHRYLFVNSALERIAGIAPSEFIGKTFDNIGLPEETWRPWHDQCEGVFKTGKPATFDTEFSSPKGIIKVETLLIPEIDEKGNTETLLSICRESPRQLKNSLTELEQTNQELIKQKRYFASIIENIPMIICRFDRELRHMYVSPASKTLCGINNVQFLGKTWHEMGIHETLYSPFQKFYEDVFKTGQVREFESQFPNCQGEMAYFQTLIIPEIDELGRVQTVLSITQDISSRKKFETEMARLERLNVIGEIAASIGHEVRNPLTIVRGYLQLFQNKKGIVQYYEQFQTIIDELDRANFIISDFLSLAKNKTVEFKLNNLNTIINRLLPLIHADAARLGHNVKIDLGSIPDINLDEKELRQLLLNLTRNAFEAMNPGGTLTIQTYIDTPNAVLVVCDTGTGIPKKILEKLGTPFQTTKENGTGLGLAVCYQIAARHDAKIGVKTSSQGTAFSICFKLSSNLELSSATNTCQRTDLLGFKPLPLQGHL